jgi:hypothetical protein
MFGMIGPPVWSKRETEKTGLISDGFSFTVYISYLVFITLVMNAIIAGIIIDTFGSLRDTAEEKKEDQTQSCYEYP